MGAGEHAAAAAAREGAGCSGRPNAGVGGGCEQARRTSADAAAGQALVMVTGARARRGAGGEYAVTLGTSGSRVGAHDLGTPKP